MGVDFKDACKTFIQSLDDGAQPLDAENPYKFQAGDVWSADAEANAPNAVYDVAIDPDLVLWVWTEDGPNKVVSKEQPQV